MNPLITFALREVLTEGVFDIFWVCWRDFSFTHMVVCISVVLFKPFSAYQNCLCEISS